MPFIDRFTFVKRLLFRRERGNTLVDGFRYLILRVDRSTVYILTAVLRFSVKCKFPAVKILGDVEEVGNLVVNFCCYL